MMSPETPPDPPDNNNQWSEGEEDFTDSDPECDPRRQRNEQHISPVEVNCAAPCETLSLRFPTRFDTNQAVQTQEVSRGLKFWI